MSMIVLAALSNLNGIYCSGAGCRTVEEDMGCGMVEEMADGTLNSGSSSCSRPGSANVVGTEGSLLLGQGNTTGQLATR